MKATATKTKTKTKASRSKSRRNRTEAEEALNHDAILHSPYLSLTALTIEGRRLRVDHAVEETLKALTPDVVRIRWNESKDWHDTPSLFFRVTLSDSVCGSVKAFKVGYAGNGKPKGEGLAATARRVESEIGKRIGEGMFPYFNYRSQSEQEKMKDPEW